MEATVYVLTNPAMEGLVKIGKTSRDVYLRLAYIRTNAPKALNNRSRTL